MLIRAGVVLFICEIGDAMKLNLFSAVAIALPFLLAASNVEAAGGNASYTYDALGRVTSANFDDGAIILYSFDAAGNRTSQITNINTTSATWGSFNWGSALWRTNMPPAVWGSFNWNAAIWQP